MLDVHPPHQTVHTWKDVFIHIAIIAVGLLIAIGLEQTVEFFHHRHQRHVLLDAIRRECEDNVQILNTHLDVNIPNMLWYRRVLAEVRSAPVVDGNVEIVVPAKDPAAPQRVMFAPERDVAPAARAAGELSLLTEEEAQAFSVLDFQAEEDQKEVDLIRAASARLTRWEFETGQKIVPGAKLNITADQRKDLAEALAYECQQLFDLLRRDNLYLVSTQKWLDGDVSVSQFFRQTTIAPLRIDQYR
jgi:hypothetical protein